MIKVPDCFPMFLDLANIPDYQGGIDAHSFIPLLFNKSYKSEAIYWHINNAYKHEPVSAIRDGAFKLMQFVISGKVELFNIENDPLETMELSRIKSKITKTKNNQNYVR